MKPTKAATLILVLTFLSGSALASESLLVCPRDLDGIVTTDNAILKAINIDKIGFLHGGMGDPATDSGNWFLGIYDTFVTAGARGRYFFQTQVWGFGQTFVANDSEFFFPICNLRGQCVQGHLQAEFEENFADEAIGTVGRLIGDLGDLVYDFEFTISSLNVGYSHPETGKISREFMAADGQLPAAEQPTGGAPRGSDCLDNEGNITISAENRKDPDRYEDREDEIPEYYYEENEEAWGGMTRDQTCGWSSGYDTLEGAIRPTRTCN
ncbi:MAG: hypothetical protein QNJ05_05490 [Woeseiaceae bacterium]|nr:hypothetical protein [Woeseiaceae bacterium]